MPGDFNLDSDAEDHLPSGDFDFDDDADDDSASALTEEPVM